MINYATYEFYKSNYRGKLSNDLFNDLIPKASREIDKYINRELFEDDLDKNTTNGAKVQFVACQLVDYINTNNTNNKKNVSSISIDGVNKTYITKNDEEIKKEVLSVINGLPQELTRCL